MKKQVQANQKKNICKSQSIHNKFEVQKKRKKKMQNGVQGESN
jgi:hypothetical protein